MSAPEQGTWVGQLSMALLFEGSKSEGLYPVLDTDDGQRLRVHVKGSQVPDAPALAPLMNQRVSLNGKADDLRGHWRLILDPDLPGDVIGRALISSAEQDSSDASPAPDLPKLETNQPGIGTQSSYDKKASP
jgi:hypothetical protein